MPFLGLPADADTRQTRKHTWQNVDPVRRTHGLAKTKKRERERERDRERQRDKETETETETLNARRAQTDSLVYPPEQINNKN